MNEYKLAFVCNNEKETVNLGKKIARLCQRGDIFALYGTLGAGKSVLARAIVQEICGMTEVPSPTFTLVQMYEAPNFEIYHYDLYRIKSPEEVFELNIEEAMFEGVCLIEWPDKMGGYLPRHAIKLKITPKEENRQIEITFAEEKTYQRFLALKD